MPRASVGLLFPLLLALALPAAKAPSAPVPKDDGKKTKLYFPITVGAKWVYEGGREEQTEVVTAVEQKPKEQAWVVSTGLLNKEGKASPWAEWEVSERGLLLLKDKFGPAAGEQWWLKLPHKAGDKWDLVSEARLHCVALEPKRVKVPAGEFDAVGVELYVGKGVLLTRWYAPEVGLVKVGDEKDTMWALKSFTPGKEE